MPEALVLLISAPFSGIDSSFKVACVCCCLVKAVLCIREGKRSGNRLLCPACPSFGGERAMAPPFSAAVGWEVKLAKALLWLVSSLPKISCPQASFIRLDPLKGYHVPGNPFTATQQSPVRPRCRLLFLALSPVPQPHPNNRIYTVAMGTGAGCLS